MRKCKTCNGQLLSTNQDIERTIEGRQIKVLQVPVRVCIDCGQIFPRVASLEEIDRMLRERSKREPIDTITLDALISDHLIAPML